MYNNVKHIGKDVSHDSLRSGCIADQKTSENIQSLSRYQNLKDYTYRSGLWSCEGIQFDTLNTLCTYLKVNASDLFQHIPIDITWVREVWFDDGESWQDQIILTITKNGKTKDYPLWLNVTRPDEQGLCNADLTFELPYALKNTKPPLPVISEEDAAECKDIIEALPLDFFFDLADQIKDDCYPDVEDTNLSVSFHWPFSEERLH